MSVITTESITQQDAINYYNNGMELLNKVAAEEQQAKVGILLATILRRNFVFVGPAGDGKSTLAQDAWRLVAEAHEPNAVVHLTGQHDHKATHIIGGELTSETKKGDGSKESNTVVLNGLIRPNLVWLDYDEFNLSDPDAVQSVNKALETRALNMSGKNVPLERLVTVGLTMNPTGKRGDGFEVSERAGSRVSVGVLVGDDPSQPRAERIAKSRAVREFKANTTRTPLEDLKPVTTLQNLQGLRRLALATTVAPEIGGLIDEMGIDAVDVLRDHNIFEGSGRLNGQILENAQGLAIMTNAQGIIGEKEVREAARYVLTGRFGMLSKKKTAEIQSIIREAIAA